jgi:hypothetical protein
MEKVVPPTIQLIIILVSLAFLFYVGRLIIKGKLREEYSFIWVVGALILIVFSFWRNGLEVLANLLGVFDPPNLVFMAAIFAVLIYLLHLSVVVSKLQAQNRDLAQKLALMNEKMNKENEKLAESIDGKANEKIEPIQ